MGEKKDTQVVQVAKAATKMTAQPWWFVSPLHILSKLPHEAVRAVIASSVQSYSPLCTLVSSAWHRGLSWLKRCHREDIAERTADIGNQWGL